MCQPPRNTQPLPRRSDRSNSDSAVGSAGKRITRGASPLCTASRAATEDRRHSTPFVKESLGARSPDSSQNVASPTTQVLQLQSDSGGHRPRKHQNAADNERPRQDRPSSTTCVVSLEAAHREQQCTGGILHLDGIGISELELQDRLVGRLRHYHRVETCGAQHRRLPQAL